MRKTLIAAALLALAGNAAGADSFAVGINTVSLHTSSGFETFTPGLYARSTGDFFGAAGVFRNSYGFTTWHAGAGYSYKFLERWDASLAVGLSYGYRDRTEYIYPDGTHLFYTYGPPELRPLVMPSIGYRFADNWGARLFVVPPILKTEEGANKAWCFSLAFERFF